MRLIAEFEITCESLPLVAVANAAPEATVQLEFQYNHGRRPLFLITVTGSSRELVTTALTDTPDVSDWSFVGEAGETHRYQATPSFSFEEQLGDAIDDLAGLASLATADAIIERIVVLPDGWRQTGWFADRTAFDEFASFWRENAEFSLLRLTQDGETQPPGDGLTDHQQEALRIAYERGHYSVPRKVSIEEIAAELGISSSAASERLRRAQSQLIEQTVAPTWPPLPE